MYILLTNKRKRKNYLRLKQTSKTMKPQNFYQLIQAFFLYVTGKYPHWPGKPENSTSDQVG